METKSIFHDLQEAMAWAKTTYPDSSFTVKAQEDGPTIISVKGKGNELRAVIYVRQK